MMIKRMFRAIFGVIVLAICHGEELNSNESEARMFLNKTSDDLFKFYDDIGYGAFVDDSYDQREAAANISILYTTIFEDSHKFDLKNFKDEELKYAFEILIEEADAKIIGKEQFLEIFDSLKELDNLPHEAYMDDYHDSSYEMHYSPDIEAIIETSNDTEELKYYWSAWRETSGKWAEVNLDKILQGIKRAANLTELSPLEFWSRKFHISDMEILMNDIQPLYSELHAFVRNQLRKKYNESVIASDGLIPDHLFEQVIHQISSNASIIEEMFPYESLPEPEMDKYTTRYMYKIAEKFFENLGFDKFPSSFWEDQLTISDADHETCHSRVWNWSPNVRLEICEVMNFVDFLVAYRDMMYLHYAKEMIGLPAYFFNFPNRLGKAIENSVLLSSSTYHNLMEVGLISDYNSTQEIEMNRLLRKAMTNLLFIPLNFVQAKVMADLLSGNIKKSDLNDHYWQLMDKYAGIGPPKDHKSNTYDLPISFYTQMDENDMSSAFTMEILSYQIYKKLCELSGKYPKEPLHLCDLNGSKEAGNALKKMMRLGASKPFHEVLGTMFPENSTVRAEGILEYYKPIKELLAEKNKAANQKPGWKSSC